MDDLAPRLNAALQDRYRVQRELGRGGMAIVFLAEDVRHRRRVALKVLRPEIAQALGRERFLHEIAFAAQLSHPHILPLHDSGEADGLLFYVMPHVEGESLRQRLEREQQLPLPDAMQVLKEVAGALGYAHGSGVVHRDIKPDNVLLAAGHAVVSDFGIARAIDAAGSERLTETGLAVGTPAYMSPEQATGDRTLDARSDIYSLGCLAYEMLGGQPPFTGPTAQAIMARHSIDPVPRLRTLRQSVPAELERVIEKALAKAPADRFATPEQFAEAAQRAVAGGGDVRAKPPQRNRVALAALAALVLVAAGWWITQTIAATRQSAIRSLAILPLENLSGDSAQEYLIAGMHDGLIGEIAQVESLRVISRQTMMRYRRGGSSDKSVPEIARELNVAGVMEGSVQRAGDTVRMRIQLIRALPDERQVWTETYQGTVRDVPRMQQDAAQALARQIGVPLSAEQSARLARTRPVDPETYEAYLRGMFHLQRPSLEDRRRGLRYLHDAVNRDPGNALAYAGLSLGYGSLGHDDAVIPDAFARARAAAHRAVTLDPGLAEAQAALALVKVYYERDWEGGEQAFRRALALNPGVALTHYHYSWYLLLAGKHEQAIAEHKRGQELDPLTLLHTADLGQLYVWLGRPDDALREAQRSLEQEPDFPRGLWALGRAYHDKGMVPEAIAAHERLAARVPRWAWVLGTTYARAGRRADALGIAATLEREGASSWNAMGLAYIYAALGDNDQAFRWLNYEASHAWVPWVAVDPLFIGLRDDPRFAALLRRFNLPIGTTRAVPRT